MTTTEAFDHRAGPPARRYSDGLASVLSRYLILALGRLGLRDFRFGSLVRLGQLGLLGLLGDEESAGDLGSEGPGF